MGNNPVTGIDPEGLDETASVLHNIFHGDGHSLALAGQGAAAFVDGFVPFWDPLASKGIYSLCTPGLRESRFMGGVARDAMISAVGAPELGTWLRNPRLYEIGQRALPDAIYEPLANLDPIARGAELLRGFPNGTPLPGVGTYAKLALTTGLTPPGYPVIAGAVHVGDRRATGQW